MKNKYALGFYSCVALCICTLLLPKVGLITFGKVAVESIGLDILAIPGGIFYGLWSLQDLRKGKNIQFNRLQCFSGFFMASLFALGNLFMLLLLRQLNMVNSRMQLNDV